MKFNIKNAIFRVKNTLISLIMIGILTIGGLEITRPQTSEADFLLDNYAYLTNLATIQENTVLAISNPIQTPKSIKKLRMVITGYSSTIDQTDLDPFITAAGTQVREGIVANNKYPFGTKIKIPELYGDEIFVVEDRMHWRKGDYHLDIWFPNYEEALQFGARITEVLILSN